MNSGVIHRPRVVNHVKKLNPELKRPIAFIARGGQGKTVAAKQLVNDSGFISVFINLNHEDSDSVTLVDKVYSQLKKSIQGFECELIEKILLNGSFNPVEIERYAAIIAKDLKASLSEPFFIVFDDLHRLADESGSIAFIDTMISKSTHKLRFIVLTRYRIQPDIIHPNFNVINNNILAFTKSEIQEYIDSDINEMCVPQAINALYTATEGWIFGVIAIYNRVLYSQDSNITLASDHSIAVSDSCDDIQGYFFYEEIIKQIKEPVLVSLGKLALMNDIQEKFVEEITGDKTILSTLIDFKTRNFFTSESKSSNGSTFHFHHLFQDCLVKYIKSQLSDEELKATYSRIAILYANENQFEYAIRYYLHGKNYLAAQDILKEYGIKLIDENRISGVANNLKVIPENKLKRYPWLAFFYGSECMNADPHRALDYFYTAIERFRSEKDDIGELLVLSQTIYSHVIVDGRLNKGSKLLGRAEELFEKKYDDLTLHSQIHVSISIASGYIFITCEFSKAEILTQKALELVTANKLINYNASIRKIRGFLYGFRGKWELFNNELEQLVTIFNNPAMNAITQLMVWLARVNLLEMEGDFSNYEFTKQHILQADKEKLVENSILGPFFAIWDTDAAIAKGQLDRADQLINTGLNQVKAYANPHIQSQLLYYRSFSEAMKGNKKEAILAADEALHLRAIAGGKCFDILCSMVLCGTYAHLGMKRECEFHFQRAHALSLEIDEKFMRTGLYAYRAFLFLNTGEKESAHKDIRVFLEILKRNKYIHFFSMTPGVILPLLSEAIKEGIYPDEAEKLGRRLYDTGFLEDGSLVPLLKIKTFGSFALSFGTSTVITAKDLSPTQQKLLSLLIVSPDKSLDTTSIKTELWPEKTSESNIGVLHIRLKERLKKSLNNYSLNVDHYIPRAKSRISLKNVTTDYEEFDSLIKTAMNYYSKRLYWQAENSFRKGLKLYQGQLFGNFIYNDSATEIIDYTEKLYHDATTCWSEILLLHKTHIHEDLSILEKAISPDKIQLARNLYQFYVQKESKVNASKIISLYRKKVESICRDDSEIENYMAEFWGEEKEMGI